MSEPTVETIRAAGKVIAEKMEDLATDKFNRPVRIHVPRTDGEQIVLALNAHGFTVAPSASVIPAAPEPPETPFDWDLLATAIWNIHTKLAVPDLVRRLRIEYRRLSGATDSTHSGPGE